MKNGIKRIIPIALLGLSLFYFKINKVKALVPGVPDAGEEEGDKNEQYRQGSYDLDDMVRVFINVFEWILGIVGSLALIMFVYGGFLFVFSGGNNDMVTKGKQTLKNAIIGLFIVFLSFMLVGMVFMFTGADPSGTAWSRIGWWD